MGRLIRLLTGDLQSLQFDRFLWKPARQERSMMNINARFRVIYPWDPLSLFHSLLDQLGQPFQRHRLTQ